MRITHGNTVLRSLEEEDLELIRNWRNDQLVNEHLLNREYISQEEQLEWFKTLDSEGSLYLLIEEDNQPLGLIYANQINLEKHSFWGNVMMGNQESKDSWTSVKAVLLLCDFMFIQCNFKAIYSVVNKTNGPALAMNRRMGFVSYEETDSLYYECCEIKEHYRKTKRIRAVVLGSKKTLLTMEDGDKKGAFLSHLMTDNHERIN